MKSDSLFSRQPQGFLDNSPPKEALSNRVPIGLSVGKPCEFCCNEKDRFPAISFYQANQRFTFAKIKGFSGSGFCFVCCSLVAM